MDFHYDPFSLYFLVLSYGEFSYAQFLDNARDFYVPHNIMFTKKNRTQMTEQSFIVTWITIPDRVQIILTWSALWNLITSQSVIMG